MGASLGQIEAGRYEDAKRFLESRISKTRRLREIAEKSGPISTHPAVHVFLLDDEARDYLNLGRVCEIMLDPARADSCYAIAETLYLRAAELSESAAR